MSTTFNGGVTINGKVYVRALAAPPAPVGCTDDPAPDWATGPVVSGTYTQTSTPAWDAFGETKGWTLTGGANNTDSDARSSASNRDGTVIVVGDRLYDTPGYSNDGALFILTASGSPKNYTEVARLVSGDPVDSDGFGSAVAMSSDGLWVAGWQQRKNVPGPVPGPEGDTQGSVHVYEDTSVGGDASAWTHRGELVWQDFYSTTQTSYSYGTSLAFTEDGSGLLIGAPGVNGGYGEVEIWTRSGSTFSYSSTLRDATMDSGDASFGRSVSISHDGKVAAIGCEGGNDESEAFYIYTSLTDITALTSSGPIDKPAALNGSLAKFGSSTAVSGDGSTIVVSHNNAGNGGFSVYDNTGTLLETVTSTIGSVSRYPSKLGTYVSVSLTGQVIAAAAPEAAFGSSSYYNGAIYLYIQGAGSTWTADQSIEGGDYGYVGYWSICLNDCGTVVNSAIDNSYTL